MPKGWPEVALADIAGVERGLSWSKDQEAWDPVQGSVPVVRIGNVQVEGIEMRDTLYVKGAPDRDITRKTVRGGSTILMVGSNGNPERVGNAYLAGPSLDGNVYASFLIGVDPGPKVVPDYLWRYLQSPRIQRAITDATAGTTGLKNLSLGWLRAMPVAVPPLAEQRRIVDLLGSADNVIQKARSINKAAWMVLSKLREQLIADASEVLLDDLIDGIDAGKSPLAVDRPPVTGERGVLKVSAVRPWGFEPTESKVVSETTTLPESSLVRHGDVLITRANTLDLVALVCRVDWTPGNLYLCDKTLRLRPRGVEPRYLVEALSTAAVRDQIRTAATGTSGSMKNISQESLRRLRVRAPAPARQLEIADLLSAVRGVASHAGSVESDGLVVRVALLDDLLRGNHAIPPSYDRLIRAAS